MQQEFINANNQDTKLLCEIHPECKQIILFLGKESERKSRIQCILCILDFFSKYRVNLNQFIYLQDFMFDPKTSMIKILHVNSVEGKQNFLQNFDEIEKFVLQFEQALKQQLIQIKENIQQIRIMFEQIAQEVQNELKLNDILNQILVVQQLDSIQCSTELINLENSLNFTSKTLDQTYIKVNDRIQNNGYQMAKNFMLNLEFIKEETESLLFKCKERLVLMFNPNDDFQIY